MALLLLAVGALRLVGGDEISSLRPSAAEAKGEESCQCGESKLSANISRTRTFAADTATLVADLGGEVRRLKALTADATSGDAHDPRALDLMRRLETASAECERRPLTEQEAVTEEAKQWRGACSELVQAAQEYGRPIDIYLNATE